MSNIVPFPGKPIKKDSTPRLNSVLQLGMDPIDIDAKFIAYAIVELSSEQRSLIKADPFLTEPIETKLKKLGWPMDHDRFIEAYAHLIDSMRNIQD